ncbi:hypothetical protein ACJJIE_03820 [Microbulbifer sp. TRSA001]|uniref:hypothetical protein n=1 Tax=Microbulbifer sp. TRSA001 TaxID=3243381 RepID=UPI00403A712C
MSEIAIRDLLWEWSRAYPERAGDSVSWPCMSAFSREMVSGNRESPEPINEKRAELTDAAVLAYLNAVSRRRDQAKAELEGLVFWLRYYYRWELRDVAKKVSRSKPWVEKMCQIVESTVEAFYLTQNAA